MKRRKETKRRKGKWGRRSTAGRKKQTTTKAMKGERKGRKKVKNERNARIATKTSLNITILFYAKQGPSEVGKERKKEKKRKKRKESTPESKK